MKRITPEDVVDAYIATGRFLIQHTWITEDGGACGLGVLFLAAGGRCEEAYSRAIYTKLGDVLGVHADYCMDFSHGFSLNVGEESSCHSEAFRDGVAARKAALAHFSKVKADQQAPEPELACSVR
jgi:hypothetical protein